MKKKKKDEAINVYVVACEGYCRTTVHCVDLMCMDLHIGEYVIYQDKTYITEKEPAYNLGKILGIIQTTDKNYSRAFSGNYGKLSPIVDVWNDFEAIDSFNRRKKEIGLEDLLEDDEEYEDDELGF